MARGKIAQMFIYHQCSYMDKTVVSASLWRLALALQTISFGLFPHHRNPTNCLHLLKYSDNQNPSPRLVVMMLLLIRSLVTCLYLN